MGEYICGKNSVLDAIDNGIKLNAVYTSKPEEIKDKQIKIILTKKSELDKMTSENHQGFIAVLDEFKYYPLESIFSDHPQKILILDHIQDPRNLGAIMRTANAAGVKHIIIPKDRAAKLTVSAVKVASGGYASLKIIRIASVMNAIQKLKKNGFWIYASALKDASPISEVKFNYPMTMIVGNESKGVSQAILKHTDQNVYIPMTGTVQSLNVSVAVGILLFAI